MQRFVKDIVTRMFEMRNGERTSDAVHFCKKITCNGTLWYSRFSRYWNLDFGHVQKILKNCNSIFDVALSM